MPPGPDKVVSIRARLKDGGLQSDRRRRCLRAIWPEDVVAYRESSIGSVRKAPAQFCSRNNLVDVAVAYAVMRLEAAMLNEDFQAEIDELTRRVIFLATTDERCFGSSVVIRPQVMSKRIKHAVMHGESDIGRLVEIALGTEVIVQFPFHGRSLSLSAPSTYRSWHDPGAR